MLNRLLLFAVMCKNMLFDSLNCHLTKKCCTQINRIYAPLTTKVNRLLRRLDACMYDIHCVVMPIWN